MGPTWTPERETDVAIARQLIRTDFPALADAEVRPFAQGWDNTAFLVRPSSGSDLVFRFPRRAIALPGIRRELAWLPQLAPLLPAAIPVPQFLGSWNPEDYLAADRARSADNADAPWPFWGAAMLAGDELAIAAPAADERLVLARQLGAFLRELHSLDPGEFSVDTAAQLAVDPLNRGNPARRAETTAACLDRLRAAGLGAALDAAAELTARAAQLPPPPAPGVICHGDLHVRHVLVGPPNARSPQVTGIIDWGDLCLADPAVDLSIAFGAFSGASRDAFFAAYGPINADRELRARALAISLNALLSEYALAHVDTQVASEASVRALLPEVSGALGRTLQD